MANKKPFHFFESIETSEGSESSASAVLDDGKLVERADVNNPNNNYLLTKLNIFRSRQVSPYLEFCLEFPRYLLHIMFCHMLVETTCAMNLSPRKRTD
jgi:hypothetical protein